MMNGTNKFVTYIIVVIMILPFLQGCRGGNASVMSATKDVPLSEATLLTLKEGDGFTYAQVRNPWDTARTLHSYLLVERGMPVPEGYGNATVIRVPMSRVVASSVIHTSLMDDFGVGDSIIGVCDAEWFNKPPMAGLIRSGKVADCGNSLAPNVEKMLSLRAGAIFVAPFQNSGGYGKLGQAGIPVIECADYMEVSPLARAEWMRFYGRLFGKGAEADSLYAVTAKEYNDLAKIGRGLATRPKVLTDKVYGQAWNVPGGKSTFGMLLEDAGGENLFKKYDSSGSVPLAPEKVAVEAANADVWLIRYNKKGGDMTMRELADENPLYKRLAPFGNGAVYGVNTDVSPYYSDMPFHPQWVLANVLEILHPELSIARPEHSYYIKLTQ